jgi:hypothetical protein
LAEWTSVLVSSLGRQGQYETYGVDATADDYGHTQRDPVVDETVRIINC